MQPRRTSRQLLITQTETACDMMTMNFTFTWLIDRDDEFRISAGTKDFLFPKQSRPALTPTQSSIQWVPVLFHLRIVPYSATTVFFRILLSSSTVINHSSTRHLHSLRYWYCCTDSRLSQNERIGQRNEGHFDLFHHSVQTNFRKASSNRSQ